ncbi:MAG: PAS domain-containing protein [Peptococcaceae bacterium]|nr:PAS domain-containing protein [Peptococcaceae bacterium]
MKKRLFITISLGLLVFLFANFFLWSFVLADVLSLLEAILIGFLVAVVLGWGISLLAYRPLTHVVQTAEEMADGALEKRIRIFKADEMGKLAESFNQLAFRLRHTINEVTEEKNRIQAILNSMADGVIALDHKARVILLNPVVEEVFGIKEETCKGKVILEVVRDYELDKIFQEALVSQRPVKKELRFLTPEPRIFRVHVTPLQSFEGGVVALLRDITERRQLEELRSEFVANVSHELRTPLTSIRGFVETLQDGAIQDPKVARDFLNIIDKEAERLALLIEDLLNLGRVEEKRGQFARDEISIREVISQAIDSVSGKLKDKGLELKVDIPDNLPKIYGEQGLLVQAFVNLLDNAVKFTEEGYIAIRAQLENEWLRVDVNDTGIGIPYESQVRIFERFYRVDKARSGKQGGTGLGLAIVKHIVEGHGGRVKVQSAYNKGSTFSVFLPTK